MPQNVDMAMKGFCATLVMPDLGSGNANNSPGPHVAHSCAIVKIFGLSVPYSPTLFQILTFGTLHSVLILLYLGQCTRQFTCTVSFTPPNCPVHPLARFQLWVTEIPIQNGLHKKGTSFLRHQNAWKQDSFTPCPSTSSTAPSRT